MADSARGKHPFYRSPVVRWSFILSGGFLTYVLSPWAASWHQATSLLWLHQVLPWWTMSAAFVIYTCLLLWGSAWSAAAADFWGFALYSAEMVALCVTAPGNPKNGFFFVALALTCVLHFAAGRLAIYQAIKERTR